MASSSASLTFPAVRRETSAFGSGSPVRSSTTDANRLFRRSSKAVPGGAPSGSCPRSPHHLGYGLQLVQPRLLDPARQEVGEVGGVDEATGRFLHSRARPLPTRWMGVSLQQPREHLRVPGVSRHLPRPSSYRICRM